ncbi:Copper chaperone CopZ [Bryocella elongata]|uniref:Copper chaperone CopZ n=1 Tax=Bryocella elongata TaxID=863522 RepID=A0A1H5ZMH9_9BACT|nr:heavy-metal-associated domain-containing protein [Bryocella elongata]SEG37412.1 Copper chaperone CopZ [Bryocella elongata]
MATVNLQIENMHCGSCVRRVTQVLNALPGTHAEEVRIGGARVATDGQVAEVEAALSAAGFPAHAQA